VGVILTGALFDGTAGLLAVRVGGGSAVVQEPRDSSSVAMPRRSERYSVLIRRYVLMDGLAIGADPAVPLVQYSGP